MADKDIRINTEITGTNLMYLQRLNDELAVLATNMARIKATGINLGNMNQSAQAQANAQQKAAQQKTKLDNEAIINAQKQVVAQKNVDNALTKSAITAQKLADQQAKLNKTVNDTHTANKTFLDDMRHNIAKMAEWAIAGTLLYGSLRLLGTVYDDIKKLDYGIAGVTKVLNSAGATAKQQAVISKQLSLAVIEVAGAYGEMGDTALKGAVEWVRLGQSQQGTIEGVRASLLAQAVAEMDTVDATKYLVATMQQFKMPAIEAVSIIDQWNKLSNTFAVRTEDMAQSAAKAGSTMRTVGVDLATLNGITTALVQSTGRSGNEIGNAMKTIGTYAYRMQTVPKLLNEAGIQVEDFAGNQKDLMSILVEVAGKWDTYTDVVRSHIAQTMAGTRRVNEFYNLIEQMPTVLKATVTAYNSHNSAVQEAGIYMDTLQKRTDQLRSHFQMLSYTIGQAFLPAMKTSISVIDNWVFGMAKLPGILDQIEAKYGRFARTLATPIGILGAGALGKDFKVQQQNQQISQNLTEQATARALSTRTQMQAIQLGATRLQNSPSGPNAQYELQTRQKQLTEALGVQSLPANWQQMSQATIKELTLSLSNDMQVAIKGWDAEIKINDERRKIFSAFNQALKSQQPADILKSVQASTGLTASQITSALAEFGINPAKQITQQQTLALMNAEKVAGEKLTAAQGQKSGLYPKPQIGAPPPIFGDIYDELIQKVDDYKASLKQSMELEDKRGANATKLNQMNVAGLTAENAIWEKYIKLLGTATGDDEKYLTQAIDGQNRLKNAINAAGLNQEVADLTVFIEKNSEALEQSLAIIRNDTSIRVANRNAVNDQRGALDEEKKGILEEISAVKNAQSELAKQGVVSKTLSNNLSDLGLRLNTVNSQYGLLKITLESVNNALEYMNNLLDINKQKAEMAGASGSALAEFDLKKLMNEDQSAIKSGDWLKHANLWNKIRAMRTDTIPTMQRNEQYQQLSTSLGTQQTLSLNANQFGYNPMQEAQKKLEYAQAQLRLAEQKGQPTESLQGNVTNAWMERRSAFMNTRLQSHQQTFENARAEGGRSLDVMRAMGYDEQSLTNAKSQISANLKRINEQLFGKDYEQQFKDNNQAILDTMNETSADFVIAQVESAKKVAEAYLDAMDTVKQGWTDTIVNVLSGNSGALTEHLKNMQNTLLSRTLENSPLVNKLSSWENGLLNPAGYAEAKETERRLALQSMLTSTFAQGGNILAQSIIGASYIAGNNIAGTKSATGMLNMGGMTGNSSMVVPSGNNVSKLGFGSMALQGLGVATQAYSDYKADNKGGAYGGIAGGIIGGAAGTLLGGNTVLGVAIGSMIGQAVGTAIGKSGDTATSGSSRQEENLRQVLSDTISKGSFNSAANVTYNISNSYSFDFLLPDQQQIRRVSEMLRAENKDYAKNIAVNQ
jgi:TP901 family phage tail tape measure protein